jgi:glutamate synthase (NADPH/NADH) large chain
LSSKKVPDHLRPDRTSDPSSRENNVDINQVVRGMGDLMHCDAQRLRILIERHHLLTGSARARDLLEDWDKTLAAFVKIMPKDYRRALLELKAEREAAQMAAAE